MARGRPREADRNKCVCEPSVSTAIDSDTLNSGSSRVEIGEVSEEKLCVGRRCQIAESAGLVDIVFGRPQKLAGIVEHGLALFGSFACSESDREVADTVNGDVGD